MHTESPRLFLTHVVPPPLFILISNEPQPYVNRLPGFAGIAFAARRKAVAAPLTGLAALRAALSPPGACCAVSGPRSALVLYLRYAATALRRAAGLAY